MVGRLADKRGFALDKIKLVTLESVPNVIAALRGGSIDAALLPGHLAGPLVDQGIRQAARWAGDETPWQLGAVFTTPRTLARRAATVDAFCAPTGEAPRCTTTFSPGARRRQAHARGDRESARSRGEELHRFVPASVDEILASAPMIDRDGRLEIADVRDQVAWYQRHGLVDKSVKVDSFLSPQARDLAP